VDDLRQEVDNGVSLVLACGWIIFFMSQLWVVRDNLTLIARGKSNVLERKA
jgi:hypothetical protein